MAGQSFSHIEVDGITSASNEGSARNSVQQFNADLNPFCESTSDTEDAPWRETPYSEGDVDYLFDPTTGKDILWSKIREEAKVIPS